jgi:hypothetical protein
MPLDARKTQHILNVVSKTFSGRQSTVVLVYESGGVYSYTAISAIWRHEQVVDPQIYDAGGATPSLVADVQMIAPIGTNFTGVVFVADTTTATQAAVQTAPKYEIIEVLPVGIAPGGSHIRVLLRRLR